jgi:hypothetical protein
MKAMLVILVVFFCSYLLRKERQILCRSFGLFSLVLKIISVLILLKTHFNKIAGGMEVSWKKEM